MAPGSWYYPVVLATGIFVCAVIVAADALFWGLFKATGRRGFLKQRVAKLTAETGTAVINGQTLTLSLDTNRPFAIDLQSVRGVYFYHTKWSGIVSSDLASVIFFDGTGRRINVPGWHALPGRQVILSHGCHVAASTLLDDIRRHIGSWNPVRVRGYAVYRWLQIAYFVVLTMLALQVIENLLYEGGRNLSPTPTAIAVAAIGLVFVLVRLAGRVLVIAQLKFGRRLWPSDY